VPPITLLPSALGFLAGGRLARSTARTLPPDDGARLLHAYASRSARGSALLEPVLREWAEPLAAERGRPPGGGSCRRWS